jgi:microcin C transport system permease protein
LQKKSNAQKDVVIDMGSYFLKRLLLIIPTLFGIMVINFIIIQAAPGGPVEQMIAKIRGLDSDPMARLAGDSTAGMAVSRGGGGEDSREMYRATQGLDPELIKDIEKLYGFDKPPLERFVLMLKNYLSFDFGESYFRDKSVLNLILEKMPVSLTLGIWTTLLVYLISIPLGIRKAIRDGTKFDAWTSTLIVVGYAIPSFLFAILLIVLFAGGSFWSFFPLRGLTSQGWETMDWFQKGVDYLWHITLPVMALVITGFASLTLLTKNTFLEELNKQYVITARAKGLTERAVLLKHVFRNAMLIVIAGFPSAILHIFFTSSLLIEIVFSLDGLGLLGFEAALTRDYPMVFGSLYIFTLLGLLLHIVGDLMYTWIDPRIHFGARTG